jgi:hypothetical protein
MAKIYDSIDGRLAAFLTAQPVFFVATAPLAGDGHLNLSPKGMGGTFVVLGPTSVAYLDYTGSGVETIAHLRENSRIALMFCAFDGAPNIVRLHGRGHAVLLGDPGYDELRARFGKAERHGERAVIVVEVSRVADACGFAVPLMDFVADRDVLDRNNARRDDAFFERYKATRNAVSIDGLPALG